MSYLLTAQPGGTESKLSSAVSSHCLDIFTSSGPVALSCGFCSRIRTYKPFPTFSCMQVMQAKGLFWTCHPNLSLGHASILPLSCSSPSLCSLYWVFPLLVLSNSGVYYNFLSKKVVSTISAQRGCKMSNVL